jgi:exodeoxyribonuclease V alpha subunit
MAWHDSDWNGAICANPEANSYCVGTHSLLSGRIEKKRDLGFEKRKARAALPTLPVENIPPCYWSINAFGDSAIPMFSNRTPSLPGLSNSLSSMTKRTRKNTATTRPT